MKVLTYYAIIAVMVVSLLSFAEKSKGRGNGVLVTSCYLVLALIILILI